jgi:hypothetical protein
MRRTTNPAQYEIHELAVAKAVVESVRLDLEAVGLTGKALKKAVESIALSVTAIYDGSTHVEVGDDHLVPVLGFATGRMRDRLLLPEEGGSSIHEFVPGAAQAEFKR